MTRMRVSELVIYPIKGCQGISVASAAAFDTGLQYDRQWMIVSADTGKFLSQRQIPKLCQVTVYLPSEALLGSDWGRLQPGTSLVVSAPGMTQLHVPLTAAAAAAAAPSIRRVTVWEWSGNAADEGDEAAEWFSKFLGRPVRLVRHLGSLLGGSLPDVVRTTDPEFAVGHEVQFADGFPILVATEESLSDLNNRLGQSLPMNRFRPNIVIAGAPAAWDDDNWRSVRISSSSSGSSSSTGQGGVLLQYVKPCSRCIVTTVDQETAAVGKEPLKTLGTFRSGKVLGWSEAQKSWTNAVFFGWNAVVEQQGRIAVGDTVQAFVQPSG